MAKKAERKLWEPLPTLEERLAYGKEQRRHTPREAHARTECFGGNRADPVKLVMDSNEGRLPELIPIRFERMLQSPFTFYRGTANIMAEDLAHTARTNIYVQSCGDCHMFNFGGYATPERKIVFDINDFDETLPAPFEWDLKRLAASVILAGRYKGYPDKVSRAACLETIKMYAHKMNKYSSMRQLEIWYSCLDEAALLNQFKNDPEVVERLKAATAKARMRTHEFVFPKLSGMENGTRKIIDNPPYIYHLPDTMQLIENARDFFDNYFRNVTDDKKILMNRFRLVDVAIKVVGVGSVGTRCFIALFVAGENDAMILQFKEAGMSVLEPYAGRSVYRNHGSRVVNGQKLMQTVSDIFLGWTRDERTGRDFYVRQLRDMKSSANIEKFTPNVYAKYSLMCGWALAKSHAKSGKSAEIAGYIGKSDVFAEAVTEFAIAYANQAAKDYEALRVALERQSPALQMEPA